MNVKDLIPIISLTCLCGDLVIVAVNSNVGIHRENRPKSYANFTTEDVKI